MTHIAANPKTELTPAMMQNLVAEILEKATKLGATAAEVDVGTTKGFSVDVREGEVETVEYNQDKDISLTVYVGQRTGSVSLSDVREEAVHAAIKAAINIARFTDEDPYAGIAEQKLLAFNFTQPDIFFPWDITPTAAIELAKNCEAHALKKDKRIAMSEHVSVGTGQALSIYGNTQGFVGMYPSSRHEMSCVLIAKSGEDMQRDYSYTIACDPTLLKSGIEIADEAVERTVHRLNAKRLKTCRVPIIFAAEEARSFLGSFVAAITGSNLYRKSSFLLDRLGTKVFPSHIRMDERPFLPKELGSAPFDDNGVATKQNVFIENGILLNYALGVYSARKLGMQTTGNAGGVHNLFITTSENNLKNLIKKMHKGLLVTEMMGQGVNLVTGDYSRGAAGFWVENGEIQYPVQEVTIAGNLKDMYASIIEVGNDVDHRGNIKTGSILLESVMVAGD